MDKRWKNLWIAIILVVVAGLIYFAYLNNFFLLNFDSALSRNDYTNAGFSFSVSSLTHPLDGNLLNDLKSLEKSSSGNDKLVLSTIISAEKEKNELLDNYFGFVSQDGLIMCDSMDAAEQAFIEKANLIEEKMQSLGGVESSIKFDYDQANFDSDYETLMGSFIALNDGCIELWAAMEYEYYDR